MDPLMSLPPPVINGKTNVLPDKKNQCINSAIEIIKKMAEDSESRIHGYNKNIKLLEKGMFYPNDYYSALKSINQQARLQWFIQKNAFYHGYAHSKHFLNIEDKTSVTQKEQGVFSLPSTTPSLAIDAYREGLTFTDCEKFCKTAYYTAIRDTFGEEKFNKFFNPLLIRSSTRDDQISSYLDSVPISGEKDVMKGDLIYVSSHPFYLAKHINGEDSGQWAMCVDDSVPKKYLGFGLDSRGVTLAEIQMSLKESYNQDPIDVNFVTQAIAEKIASTYSPEQKKITASFKDHQFGTSEFLKQGGQLMPNILRINVEKLNQLAKKS